jgi:plastocyanin
MVPALEQWLAAQDRNAQDYEQALLESVFVLQSKGEFRPEWIRALLHSNEPRMRAAAVETLRFQSAHGPVVQTLLKEAANDDHPRVRMAVLNVVSHLRAEVAAVHAQPTEGAQHSAHSHAPKDVDWSSLLLGFNAQEPAVQQMLVDLKAGTHPMKGRSVPVLDVNPATEVPQWLLESNSAGAVSGAVPAGGDKDKLKTAPQKTWVYRTFIEAAQQQSALLSVKHGYLDVSANGVQLLSADSPFSSQQQVQMELKKGLNVVEVAFRKLKSKDARPAIFVYDMVGQPLSEAKMSDSTEALKSFEERWKAEHAADLNAIKVQAVPNLMQFSPKEIRVRAGQVIRLVFENPDLMQHNLVLVEAGSAEEVGGMADQMAAKPDAFSRNFIPESGKVLQSTPLVNPNGRAELEFKAPQKPGVYPYICTFPGHGREMRG